MDQDDCGPDFSITGPYENEVQTPSIRQSLTVLVT